MFIQRNIKFHMIMMNLRAKLKNIEKKNLFVLIIISIRMNWVYISE